MAASAGTAFVTIKPDFAGFGKELNSGLSAAGGALSGFGSTMTKYVTVPIVAATGLAATFGLTTAMAAEQAEAAFKNLLPAGSDVTAFMGQLTDFAAKTPFDVGTVNKMAQGLMGVGVQAKDVLPLLTGMGDAVSGFGGSAADVDSVNYAMKQIIGSGRAYTQDINQISNTVPTIWQEVAAQMGVTVGEARDMAKEGEITSDVLVNAFNKPVGPLKNLSGSMQTQSETLAGVWSTFTDTVGIALGETFTENLPAIKQGLTDLGAAIGPALEAAGPAFSAIVQAMVPLVTQGAKVLTMFANMSPHMQSMVVYAVAGAAALGPLAKVMGTTMTAISGLAKVAGLLVKAFNFARLIPGIMRLFAVGAKMIQFAGIVWRFVRMVVLAMRFLAMGLLTNPIVLIVVAIVAAIALAAYLIYRNWDTIKAAFQAAWDFIQPILMTIWSVIQTVFSAIWGFIQVVWDAVIAIFTTAFNIIWTALEIFFALITLPFRIWWMVVSAVIQAAWDFLVAVFQAIWDFIQPLWESLWNAVTAVVSAVWGFFSSVFSTIWNFIVSVFEGIKTAVTNAWRAVWDFVKGVIESIWGWIQPKFNAIRDFIIGVFNTVKDKITGIWDTIKSIVQGAIDGIKAIISGIWDGFKGIINIGIGIVNSFIRGINKVIGMINSVPGAPDIPTIPEIPKLAKGGVVTEPTTALIGEKGPEAVIPLSKLDAMLGDAGGQQEQQPIYLTIKIGDQDITDMIEEVTRKDQAQLARLLVGGRRL